MTKLEMLGVFLTYLFHCSTYFMITKQKYGKEKSIFIWFMIVIFSLGFVWSLSISPLGHYTAVSISYVATLAIFATAFFVLSGDNLPKAIFLFTVYSIFYVMVQFISGYIAFLFFSRTILSLIIIRSLIYIVTLLLYYFYGKNRFELISQNIKVGWLPLNMVSVLIFIYLSYIVFHKFGIYDNGTVTLFFLMTSIVVAVYFVIFNTIRYMHEAAVKDQVQMQSDFLMWQVETMQDAVLDARRSRHDIRHHNLLIAEYVKNGETTELLKYLEQYEEEAESRIVERLCENIAANNILSAYAEKARQNNIDIHFDVVMEQNIGVKDTDLVAILANMLENCILGCIRSEKENQKIEIYIAKKLNKLVIQTQNTCAKDIAFKNGLPYSKDKSSIGVSSMAHSVSKYSGEIDYKYKDAVMITRILLNLN